MHDFIRKRITELRIKKGVSEYQMSYELGQNKSYIQSISSGRAIPSMEKFFDICDYFDMTPSEFFDIDNHNPSLIRTATEKLKKLSEEDILLIINVINHFI